MDYSHHYAKFHPQDPAHRHGLTLLHRRILEPLLPADRTIPIIDVGCGMGYALEDVRSLGYLNIQGIEPNPALAASARSRGLAVETVADSTGFLNAREGAYQVVLLMDVLEHVSRADQPAFVRSIVRSLKGGGRLICSVPNAGSAIASFWLHNDYTHQSSFTSDSLGFLLEETGFGRIEFSGPEFFLRPKYLFWVPSNRALAWWLRCALRAAQRATYVAELGWSRGRRMVLTPNLLAVADKTT